MKTIAIIGARSGSKGVKNKNIRQVGGKPLMAWVIESAKRAEKIDRLIISTDSQEYADIAKRYGAEAPFLRPAEIAGDTAHDLEYLTHTLEWLGQNENYRPDIIIKVSANCPMFQSEYFDKAVEIFKNNPELDAVYPIYKADKHPYKMWKPKQDGALEPFLPKSFTGLDEPYNMSRQMLPPAYIHCGVFALKYETIIQKKATAGDKIGYFEIPPEHGFDIDNELDFQLAELLLKEKK